MTPTIFESGPKKGKKFPSAAPAEMVNETSMSPLTSYAHHPVGVRFETQEEKELVVLFLRQHLIVLVPQIALGILLILAPSVLLPLAIRMVPGMPFSVPPGYFIVGTIFWYVATFGFFLSAFLHWYFNIYIITNKRVVDIDFVNLLYKEFTEATLDKIEDVTYTTRGVTAAVFDYGDVLIQTAGEKPNIEFMSIPHPDKVVKTLSGLILR